jgi:hypothetical protein
MSDIKLDRCDVVDYVKNTLDNSKTNFDHVTGAKYHHNTKYCDASSVIRFGILTMSELNRLKLRHDSPESLKIMNDTLSQVNGLNGVSLAVTGLDDLYPDEDEFDPFLSDAVDFRIADTISPRPGRNSTKYGNEFIYPGVVRPEEFRAIDIRILEYIEQLENNVSNMGSRSIEELKNNYNNLLDMLKVLKDANLDIPVRETFGGFSIDKEKMSECPRIVIK